MAAAVPLCEDFSADALRRLARASRDAGQGRRLLALAVIYDGGRRGEAARVGAVGLRTVRDGVLAFNAEGPAGLIDAKAPGQPCKLSEAQRRALAEAVEQGPDPERDGVVRWRRRDLAAQGPSGAETWRLGFMPASASAWTRPRWGASCASLSFAKMSARPRHYAQDPAALLAFKKGAARRGGGDPRQAEAGHGDRAVVAR